MSRQSILGVLFVLIVGSASARAQVPLSIASGQAPLSLRAALDEALTGNLTLAALRQQFDARRLRPAAERFLAAPTLEAQIWKWPLSTVNPLDTEMYMFTMRQDLPGRGKRILKSSLLEKEAEQASNDIAIAAREIINQVKQAYADLFVSRQAIVVHQRSVDLLRHTTELMTARYGAGRGAQQDVLETIAAVARVHTDQVTFEEQAGRAAVRLNVLMNRPPGAPIGELEEAGSEGGLQPVEDLQRLAVHAHPELRAAQLEIERAGAALAVANREYEPDFVVGGGYQLMPRSFGAWTAFAGMTWPNAPWSRKRLDAAKAVAVAETAAARAREQVVLAAVGSAVQDAYIRATAAQTRATMLRDDVIPQTQQVLEAARLAYQSERGDAVAVVDVQRMLLDVQLEYFHAVSDLQQARADLERAVGVDLPLPPRLAAREVR